MEDSSQPSYRSVLSELEQWGAARDWVGADPYEGLRTPLARMVRGRRAGQAVTQAYKRLPFAPPWPLRAAPAQNAKALALALAAYSSPAGARLGSAERFRDELPERLRALRLGESRAWGYPFPVQTRNIAYGATEPNAIATSFAVGGLLDAHAATGREDLAELALGARPFLLSLLERSGEHGAHFTYVAQGSDLIHNANLLVCGALARLHAIEPDERAAADVAEAVQTTIALQREDGLWPYGERANYAWADNFHTAYLLEGLMRTGAELGVGGEAADRGIAAWSLSFFEPDGAARYYPDRRHPLEPHCYASAIDLLVLVGGEADIDLAERVAASSIRELWIPGEHRFAFRRGPRGLNRREFMRWTNAPMFRALASLAGQREAQA